MSVAPDKEHVYMRRLLFAAVALGAVFASTTFEASAAPADAGAHMAPARTMAQDQSLVTSVRYYHNHHYYNHRRWHHGHWRYW
jgi:hypothetical protein